MSQFGLLLRHQQKVGDCEQFFLSSTCAGDIREEIPVCLQHICTYTSQPGLSMVISHNQPHNHSSGLTLWIVQSLESIISDFSKNAEQTQLKQRKQGKLNSLLHLWHGGSEQHQQGKLMNSEQLTATTESKHDFPDSRHWEVNLVSMGSRHSESNLTSMDARQLQWLQGNGCIETAT